MSVSSVNNKRIAKNTLFLYFRQILVMAVSLYTVRVVLEVLGEEDYGIYNVVGGFVALFNILSGALSVAIGRFITYEMGQPDATTLRLRRISSESCFTSIDYECFRPAYPFRIQQRRGISRRRNR